MSAHTPGLDLRDQFAIHATEQDVMQQGEILRYQHAAASGCYGCYTLPDGWRITARYMHADAMLKARALAINDSSSDGAGSLDARLPCDITVGAMTFRKGVSMSTFVEAAKYWHREAFPEGYNLTPEQKAANLQELRDLVTSGSLAGRLGVAVELLAECLDPMQVSDAVIEDEDGNAAIRDLIERVRSFVAAYRGERAAAIKAAKGEA